MQLQTQTKMWNAYTIFIYHSWINQEKEEFRRIRERGRWLNRINNQTDNHMEQLDQKGSQKACFNIKLNSILRLFLQQINK